MEVGDQLPRTQGVEEPSCLGTDTGRSCLPLQLEFPDQYRKWHSCSPADLYNAPVTKRVPNVGDSYHHLPALGFRALWQLTSFMFTPATTISLYPACSPRDQVPWLLSSPCSVMAAQRVALCSRTA
jgi:hypothetical protein